MNIGLLLLSLLAMALLHTAANMLSDVIDWKRGLDREATPVSGAVVRGLLSPQQVLKGVAVLFVLGSALGLILIWLRGILILYIGIAGIILGLTHSRPITPGPGGYSGLRSKIFTAVNRCLKSRRDARPKGP